MVKRCFVIMPYSKTSRLHTQEYWTRLYLDYIRPCVEDDFGYECYREATGAGNIMTDIMKQLTDSDLVIAILTDNNPNVWYELGIRHSLKTGTLLMLQEGHPLPFDLKSYNVLFYDDNKDNFRAKLADRIREWENLPEHDSPVKNYFAQCSARPCWVASRVADTPMNLFGGEDPLKVFSKIKERLVIVGQNLYSISLSKNNIKEQIFSALKAQEITIELMLCAPEDYLINAISEVAIVPSDLFRKHLSAALHTFQEWVTESKEQKLPGNLFVRTSRRIGNVSLSIIDPDRLDGQMLLTPVLGGASKDRPCFWITKADHAQVFDYYVAWYEFVADEHENLLS